MKKQIATLLLTFFWIQSSLMAFDPDIELNASYDYFRGLPEGSWNGNSGVYFAGNAGADLFDCMGVQLGGSYGFYNWNGRENLVFKNSRRVEQQAFLTVGADTSFCPFNFGLVYDRQFVKHLGIYDVNASFDQLRFQTGYMFCQDEIGIWGTAYLTTAHKRALGVPLSFRAINQLNVFWTHFFENCAMSSVWIGAPYSHSLYYSHKTVGTFISGFSLRAPLTERLFVDGHGAYMWARKSSGCRQSRNYDANVCIGITYFFGGCCPVYSASYMPLANNANFMVDTNLNQ